MKAIKLIPPDKILKWINYWPPYLVSGIKVKRVWNDGLSIQVAMNQHSWNTNYVGSHFGGSLYSMCDPFYMFILLNKIGQDHIVWDKSADIEFVKPAVGKVTASFEVSEVEIDQIKDKALKEFSFIWFFNARVLDKESNIVANVKKGLYIRRKDAKERFKTKS